MYAVERRASILEHARESGRVEVARTCQRLEVAPETIRRDLRELERQGLLRRVHGGAVPIERVGFEGLLARRMATNHEAKSRIAAAALPLLEHAESLYLDEGSGMQLVAEMLDPPRPLTVVTNSLPTATSLAERPNVTVMVLGGRVRTKTMATLEHFAERMLADLVIDVAIMGANGVSGRGCTCPDASVAAIKTTACRVSRRRVLLADAVKLGVESFCRFADVADFEAIVTDRSADHHEVAALRDQGPEVLVV